MLPKIQKVFSESGGGPSVASYAVQFESPWFLGHRIFDPRTRDSLDRKTELGSGAFDLFSDRF